MEARNRFSLFRKLLAAIDLSPKATDDGVGRIPDFLSAKQGIRWRSG